MKNLLSLGLMLSVSGCFSGVSEKEKNIATFFGDAYCRYEQDFTPSFWNPSGEQSLENLKKDFSVYKKMEVSLSEHRLTAEELRKFAKDHHPYDTANELGPIVLETIQAKCPEKKVTLERANLFFLGNLGNAMVSPEVRRKLSSFPGEK